MIVLSSAAKGDGCAGTVIWQGSRGTVLVSGVPLNPPINPGVYFAAPTAKPVPDQGEALSSERLVQPGRGAVPGVSPPKIGEALGGAMIDQAAMKWVAALGREGKLAIRWYRDAAAITGAYDELPMTHEGAPMTDEMVITPATWRALERVAGRGELQIIITTPAIADGTRVWFHATGPRGFVHFRS